MSRRSRTFSPRSKLPPRIEQLNLATFRLHPLKGDRKGFWSITVQANWRILFRFEDGKAFDVELIDYH